MIFYITQQPSCDSAATRRVNFVLGALEDEKVTCVGLSSNGKTGWQKQMKSSKGKHSYVWLMNLNRRFLLDISFSFALFLFLLFNVRSNDCILVYNFTPRAALPIILLRSLKKLTLIIELEEVYGKISDYERLGIFESHGFKIADGFILASKTMIPLTGGKPFVVSAGYYEGELEESLSDNSMNENVSEPFLLYSGRIDRFGGIFELILEFKSSSLKVPLVITGSGDSVSKLKQLVDNDERIVYLGNITRSRLLNLVLKDCICINPMNARLDYAEYSFPSKVVWWLALGKIVLSTPCPSVVNSDASNYVRFFSFSNCDTPDSTTFIQAVQESLNKLATGGSGWRKNSREFLSILKKQQREIHDLIAERICSFS